MTAEAYIVLGEVQLAAGSRADAMEALETAEALALQKESLVLALEARSLIDQLPKEK